MNRKESLAFRIGRAASVLTIMGTVAAWGITHRDGDTVRPNPAPIAQNSPDFISTNISTLRPIPEKPLSPGERFQAVLSFMENLSIPEVKKAARYYSSAQDWENAKKTQFRNPIILDSLLDVFKQEPVGLTQFILEGGGRESQVLISERALSKNNLTPADWTVYLLKELLLKERANAFKGSPQQKTEYLEEIEHLVWGEVWNILGTKFGDRVSDPDLQASWQAYQASNQPPAVTQK